MLAKTLLILHIFYAKTSFISVVLWFFIFWLQSKFSTRKNIQSFFFCLQIFSPPQCFMFLPSNTFHRFIFLRSFYLFLICWCACEWMLFVVKCFCLISKGSECYPNVASNNNFNTNQPKKNHLIELHSGIRAIRKLISRACVTSILKRHQPKNGVDNNKIFYPFIHI